MVRNINALQNSSEHQHLLTDLYAAFNRRDIDAALARMTDTIDWPKASEGGRVVGKAAIRDYWTRQWTAFDPHVTPVTIAEQPDGRFSVEVHQVVRDLGGQRLMDGIVTHLFTLADGQVARMDLQDAPEWHP